MAEREGMLKPHEVVILCYCIGCCQGRVHSHNAEPAGSRKTSPGGALVRRTTNDANDIERGRQNK